MPAAKKEAAPKPSKLESLRSEIVEVLEEYLDELNRLNDENPSEHLGDSLRNAQTALRFFKPDVPNVYS